ncbi:MAG TPA: nicotinate-nicotinamide nucleotide adenylyltransferase, partial [Solirubrobacteraceae bacterium]|nr:nicotinate-nicotinamide nucleotide adenylyltransferase [Solirubrobacteraceae bacterium]
MRGPGRIEASRAAGERAAAQVAQEAAPHTRARADGGDERADGEHVRIGILGGTFNPPHVGHIALARRAREELGLERVLLMPAYRAPNKRSEHDDPGPEHRLQMCRLAVVDAPGVQVSAMEIERGGVSYTVDSLQAIHDGDPELELTLIVGADAARTLAGWREPARVLG